MQAAAQSGGWTSLHEAALLGAEDIAKLLIENGAEIQVKKDDDQTPLDVAIEKGQEDVVNLLKTYVNTSAYKKSNLILTCFPYSRQKREEHNNHKEGYYADIVFMSLDI
ncbi:ankyrin repeat domain-containing protein [Priestia megaterium]|uniref:ankyrin repeat domain-containing protein n=1 Tax=Priestia megaterium TaxID=1404 RepID=UPI001EE0D022|nr:ankyrin repeat domain-containing protein [Priestia megaterium]MDH3171268.1 ankyrin repeat domain-containing protein [Priestia megaterium]